jgi:uncharacterized membrane protein
VDTPPSSPDDEAATGESSEPRGFARLLRDYLVAGLLIWIPVMVTIWVLEFLTRILDQSLVLLPKAWRPEELFGLNIHGWGIVPSLLLLVGTGLVARNLFGRRIVVGVEDLIKRIPVIGAVYGGAKTFSETVLTDKGRSFKQVVLTEFPRKGMYSLAFITADEFEEGNARTGQDLVCLFVPHTPNAATGFIVIVPRSDMIPLDMTIDEAFKLMVTLGVVVPTWRKRPIDGRLALPEDGP